MKNFQYYVEQGADADANGAQFPVMGTGNDTVKEFYNFVGKSDTLAEARAAKDVPLATFSYNLAETPVATTGTISMNILANNTQGDSEALFGALSGNAENTLRLPACTVTVPNVAINNTGDTEFLITLEDRTVFKIVRTSGGNVSSSPLGHGGEMGGRERAARLAGRF